MGVTLHFSGVSQDSYLYTAKASSEKLLKFYPNPATTVINFDFQKNTEKSFYLVIYNFLGKKVIEVSSLNTTNHIDLSDFSRGVYIFQLRDKSGRVIESGKFQVSK